MLTQSEFLNFLNTPQNERDTQWEQKFLTNFPNCKMSLLSEHPQLGPDKFPYMFVEIREDSTEHALTLLKWISENGIGLAVNPNKSYPDFVFTFGMIWNFTKTGNFLTNPIAHVHHEGCSHDHDKKPSSEPQALFVGSPSDLYLPKAVRSILKEFLKQQGVMLPKITMLSPDKENFDLCFSVESFGSPKGEEHEGILQALSWFLPAHYSLAMVSEEGLPEFEEL